MPHNSRILFRCSLYPFANKKLPLSKAQNCCTAKTSDGRSGLKHQSKQIRFHYAETTVEIKTLWVADMDGCLWEKTVLETCFTAKSKQCSFLSVFLDFQGGAEHNVPVVISKIFKDQVGKKESCSFLEICIIVLLTSVATFKDGKGKV